MEAKIKQTEQREALLEFLEEMKKEHKHLTAEEIYIELKKRMPGLSLSTVYRNLDKLAGLGMVQKIDIPNSQARFDANAHEHNHIRCIVCGKVEDLPTDIDIKLLDQDSISGIGYELVGVKVEVLGVCSACRQKKEHN